MKLNLGCGSKKVEGFTGVDIKHADIVADIRHLPFPDESVDEIMAIHVCEHAYQHEIVAMIREWLRVLKPDGKMALELPCFDKVVKYIRENDVLDDRMVRWPLFGQPETHKDGEAAVHKYCWTRAEFKKMLEYAGCVNVSEDVPHYHVPQRDMRFVCYK
jgi:predicted SAM-dependent methyltransferase